MNSIDLENLTELKQFLDDNIMELKTDLLASNLTDSNKQRIIVELVDKPLLIDCGGFRKYQTQVNIKVIVVRENLDNALKVFGNKMKQLQYNFNMQYFENEEVYQLSYITSFFVREYGD